MNIRDVLSLFERPAVKRWLGLFGGNQGGPARPEATPPEPEPGCGLPVSGAAAVPAGEMATAMPQANEPEVPVEGAGEQGVVPLPDPEIDALRQQVAVLKGKIADLYARRVEMEQLIQRFEYCQYRNLGQRLAENLRLRHEYLSLKARRSGATADLEAEEEAAAELDAYRRVREVGDREIPALAAEDRDELKRLYRAAVMRCHPDRVAVEDKAAAHDFFLRTQAAYRQNDLDGLRLIHRQLTEGASLAESAPGSEDGECLRRLVSDLQEQAADLILAIQTMQLDEVYRRAKRTEDWEAYFASVQELLDAESADLKRKIRTFSSS